MVAAVEERHVDALVSALSVEFYVDADALRQGHPNALEHEPDPSGHPAESRSAPWREALPSTTGNRPAHSPSTSGRDDAWTCTRPRTSCCRSSGGIDFGGGISDRQWRDITAIVRVQGERLDRRPPRRRGRNPRGSRTCWTAPLPRPLLEAGANPSRGGSVLFHTAPSHAAWLGKQPPTTTPRRHRGGTARRAFGPPPRSGYRTGPPPTAGKPAAKRGGRVQPAPTSALLLVVVRERRPRHLLRRVLLEFRHRHLDRLLELRCRGPYATCAGSDRPRCRARRRGSPPPTGPPGCRSRSAAP